MKLILGFIVLVLIALTGAGYVEPQTIFLILIGLLMPTIAALALIYIMAALGIWFAFVKTGRIRVSVVGTRLYRIVHETAVILTATSPDVEIIGPADIKTWWEKVLRRFFGIRYLGFPARLYGATILKRHKSTAPTGPDWITEERSLEWELWVEMPLPIEILGSETKDGLSINTRFLVRLRSHNVERMLFILNGRFFESSLELIEGEIQDKLRDMTIDEVKTAKAAGTDSVFGYLSEVLGDFGQHHTQNTGTDLIQIEMVNWDPANAETRQLIEKLSRAKIEGEALVEAARLYKQEKQLKGEADRDYLIMIAQGSKAEIEVIREAMGENADPTEVAKQIGRFLAFRALGGKVETFFENMGGNPPNIAVPSKW